LAEGGIIPFGQDPGYPLQFVSCLYFCVYRENLLQADLEADPIVRGRPIILNGKDWHSIWVSSKVLQDNSPLPDNVEGGFIVRDDDGRPTGWFLQLLVSEIVIQCIFRSAIG
jgi:hypothetical protein